MPSNSDNTQLPTKIIRPSSKRLINLNLGELWRYHELLYFLAWRDVKVRYKQTLIGVGWAVLQPVFTMVIFSLFFGRWAKMPSDGFPYPIFTYCALLPWQLFANALSNASNSVVQNRHLISKIYFPRLIVPIASVLGGLMDFLIAFMVLLGLMAYYGITPSLAVVTLPLFIALAIATSLTVGVWLSALNVQFRDVRYTLPFLTQIWLFATPIAYASSLVPDKWRTLYGLNPMVGVVEGFRWAMLGKAEGPGLMLWVSVAMVVLLLLGGLIYFRRLESTFADIV